MPTILRSSGYRFFFYAADGDEPPHIHVARERDAAKFWLDPVWLARSRGFTRHEINQIQRLVEEKQELLLRSWNGYFG
ncbi:MAG: DUF4160 domain-containing protein [Anaerolineales bacterium]|nr:DUF4160 domain-containing protein [Anaerolineales bacterium]